MTGVDLRRQVALLQRLSRYKAIMIGCRCGAPMSSLMRESWRLALRTRRGYDGDVVLTVYSETTELER